MNSINKPNNIFVEDINNIIGLNKCYTHGSFIKYGLEKACDIDCNENIHFNNTEPFKKYINKIANNKNILFVTSDFRLPYEIFEIIYNKLGYTDGLFKIHYNDNNTLIIRENIKKIPDEEIKNNIEKLFNEFINNKSLQNLINIKSYTRKLIFPKWTLEELLKGEKKYFDKLYKIEDGIKSERFSIEIIYLDEPYKYMTISNNINFQKETKALTSNPLTSIVSNNMINYYTVSKKLIHIIKRIFFTIKDYGLKKYLMRKHNEISKFRDNYGNLNHSMCINKNKSFIYNLEYNKYKGKDINKEINYKQLSDKYNTAYESDFNKLNNLFKSKYYSWIRGVEPYLKEHVRFF